MVEKKTVDEKKRGRGGKSLGRVPSKFWERRENLGGLEVGM